MTAGPTDPQNPTAPPAVTVPPAPGQVPPAPPAPYAPMAGSFGQPVGQATLSPVAGIGLAVAVAAAVSAIYGLIFAESNTIVGYILVAGGLGVAVVLGKTALPPAARAVIGAVLIGGFGFAATVLGGYGQIAKQGDESFSAATSDYSFHDVVTNIRGFAWFLFVVAIVVSFAYGLNGGGRRFTRR